MKFRMFLLLLLLAGSCTPQPQATPGPDTAVTSPPEANTRPLSPHPGDADLTRGNIYVSESSLVIRESYPPQISLSISGDLPTPCNQLRAEVSPPDQENNIKVDVYTVVDPDKVCIQGLEPFEENIDLGTFPTGHYAVWVNGEKAGEFDS